MKFEVYVYELCFCVSRIGIRFVYELFIYVYWSKLVSSPVADTAYHSSHVADTVNHSLSLVSLIGSVVECWQCCVGGLTLCVIIVTEQSSLLYTIEM